MPVISGELRLRKENICIHSICVCVCLQCYWKCTQLLDAHLQSAGIEETTTACIHTMAAFCSEREKIGQELHRDLLSIKDSNSMWESGDGIAPDPRSCRILCWVWQLWSGITPPSSDRATFADQMLAGRGEEEKQLLWWSRLTVVSSGLGDRFPHSKSQLLWLMHRTVHLSPPQGERQESSAIL